VDPRESLIDERLADVRREQRDAIPNTIGQTNLNTPIRTATSFAPPRNARSEPTNDPTLATVKRCVHVRSPVDPVFMCFDDASGGYPEFSAGDC